jgi:hypothetical protein
MGAPSLLREGCQQFDPRASVHSSPRVILLGCRASPHLVDQEPGVRSSTQTGVTDLSVAVNTLRYDLGEAARLSSARPSSESFLSFFARSTSSPSIFFLFLYKTNLDDFCTSPTACIAHIDELQL